jgi:hypothetical protein
MFESNQEKQVQIEQLKEFFAMQKDGATLSWLEIEQGARVSMDYPGEGRDMARVALKRLSRAYETLHGKGIRLSSPDNALVIVGCRVRKVGRQVSLGRRTLKFVSKHRDQMLSDERGKLDVAAGFFGAFETAKQLARASIFTRREPAALPAAKPIIPNGKKKI